MNFRVRFRNKQWLITFLALSFSIVFKFCSDFGIMIPVSENQLMGYVSDVCLLLGMLGVFIDPTTEGIRDSEQAMEYEEPKERIDYED